tara:strand:+ start:16492 stop:17700 length:1209 start_codon:yes stop_codon:yes gene_type:complete
MKNYCSLILLILLSLKITGQEITEMDIESTYLNEIKVMRIFIPKGYIASKKKFPLTLILDSELLFDSYVASAKLFSESHTNPDQIIVGIKQFKGINKEKDYGYDNLNSFPSKNSINTIAFIKKELIPTLKRRYKVANFKTIIGTDISANFLNYFLFDAKPVFDAYVSINPELAPDMPIHMQNYIEKIKKTDTYYYMSHSNRTIQKNKKLIDASNAGLENISSVNFNYKYENLKSSSPIVSIAQSLASAQEFIFSMYSPISNKEYENNVSFLSPAAAIQYLLYKYENLEYTFGEKIKIRQEDFIKTERVILDKEKGVYLEEYGQLALETYPRDPIGNYYIGQYFEKREEYPEALLAYKKGFAKIPQSSPRSYGYYMNIKRIITLQKLEKEKEKNSINDSIAAE